MFNSIKNFFQGTRSFVLQLLGVQQIAQADINVPGLENLYYILKNVKGLLYDAAIHRIDMEMYDSNNDVWIEHSNNTFLIGRYVEQNNHQDNPLKIYQDFQGSHAQRQDLKNSK